MMRVITFIFLCCIYFTASAENTKIGFINSNQVVTSLTQYQQSIDRLSREFEPKKQELLALFKHIELLRNNISSNIKANKKNSIELEQTKLSNLEESFKEETEFWQKSMNNRKINLLNEIEILVNKTINDFALEEGYDLILYKDVAFVSDEVNITQKIIDKIEKQSQ